MNRRHRRRRRDALVRRFVLFFLLKQQPFLVGFWRFFGRSGFGRGIFLGCRAFLDQRLTGFRLGGSLLGRHVFGVLGEHGPDGIVVQRAAMRLGGNAEPFEFGEQFLALHPQLFGQIVNSCA
jgi:hypothetical protein